MGRFPGRAPGERGTALLEAAVVTPLFFLLLFGVTRGLRLHERLSVANGRGDEGGYMLVMLALSLATVVVSTVFAVDVGA